MDPITFGPGELTFLAATGFFGIYVAAHLATAFLSGRFDTIAPREHTRRVRVAHRIALLHLARAAWFAVLFAVAAATVVAVTPELPLLEVSVVYGGTIGVVFSLMQANDWLRAARGVARSAAQLRELAVHAGMVVDAHLVTVRVPQHILDRVTAGDRLTADEAAQILPTLKEAPQ